MIHDSDAAVRFDRQGYVPEPAGVIPEERGVQRGGRFHP